MRGKRIIWVFCFTLLLMGAMGCGKKAPPRLPEKSSLLTFATKAQRHEGTKGREQNNLITKARRDEETKTGSMKHSHVKN